MTLSPSKSHAQLVTPPGSLVNVVSVKFTANGDGPAVTFAVKLEKRPLCAVLTMTRPSCPVVGAR
jgi:hypothetical protein